MNEVSPKSIPPPRPPPPPPQLYKRQSLDLSNHHLVKFVEDKKRNSIVSDYATAFEQKRLHQNGKTQNANSCNEVDLAEKVVGNGDERPRNDPHASSSFESTDSGGGFSTTEAVDNNEQNGQEESGSSKKPKPLPRHHFTNATKPVAAQRSLHKTKSSDENLDEESTKRKQKPVAPPRQCGAEPANICFSDTDSVECPKGATSVETYNTTNKNPVQNVVKTPTKNVSNPLSDSPLHLVQQASTSSDSDVGQHHHLNRQKRPSIEAPLTPPLDPLRLAPERSSIRRQLKSVLTPPLPRPLIPAPPPPPRIRPLETLPSQQETK